MHHRLRLALKHPGRWVTTPTGQRCVTVACLGVQVWAFTLWPVWSWAQVVPVGCALALVWMQVVLERRRRTLDRLTKALGELIPGARPQGVVVRHADGTTTPVELAYRGTDDDGVHVWSGATMVGPGDELHAAVLPPRTAIDLPTRPGP